MGSKEGIIMSNIADELEEHRQFVIANKWLRYNPVNPGECCIIKRIDGLWDSIPKRTYLSGSACHVLNEAVFNNWTNSLVDWNDFEPGVTKERVIHYLAKARNLAKKRGW